MGISDNTASVLIFAIVFTFFSIWLIMAYSTPNTDVTFDAEIIEISDHKYKVQHPDGDYVWVGKNFHDLDIGDQALISIKNNKGYISESIRE